MTDIPPAREPPAAVAEGSEPQLTGVAEAKTWPVTIVFADVVDSTRLSGQLGKGAYTSIMERFQQEGRRIVREHGGWAKAAGDAVIGIFGVPVKGDDALQAVNVAVRLRGQVLPALNDELQRKWGVKVGVRIGVHTDEALVRVPTGTPLHDVKQDDRVDVLDEVANLAQRLQANAEQGQILIGQATYQRVRAWVTAERTREKLQLSGVDRHVPAWALFTVYSQPRLPSVPMVGRKDELSLLNLTFERARRSGRLHLVTVLGEAGVGKTRLVEEFVRGLGEDARVLRGQCQQHGSQQRGESVMYGPIMQMLQQAAEIPAGLSPDAIRSRLRPLAGDDPHRAAQLASLLWVRDSAAEPEGTLRALREALQLLARQRPLVLVIDDLQWARGTLLHFIEARQDHSPLSIQLLAAVLVEDKFIVLKSGRWRVRQPLAEVGELPNTIDVVRARLDRLPDDELGALEGAAVIGPTFLLSELHTLANGSDRARTRATIERLVRKTLLRPGRLNQDPVDEDPWAMPSQPAADGLDEQASAIPTASGDDEFYSFAHPLVREAAYQRLSAEQRGQLHERYADIFKQRSPAGAAQINLLVGNHLDDAYQAYREQGRPEEALEALASRAGEELAANGHQGVLRGGLTSTVQSVLRRAIELLPPGGQQRLTVQLDLARTLLGEADLSTAARIYQEVISTAQATRNVAAEVAARLWELDMVAFNDPDRTLREAPRIVERALAMFEGSDDSSLAKARYLSAYLAFTAGRTEAASIQAERARDEAARVGDIRLEATIRRLYCVVVFWGPAPAQEVVEQAEEQIAWAQAHGMYSLAAGAHYIVARATAIQGRFDEARASNALAHRLLTDLGELLTLGAGVLSESLVEWYAGELDTAERILRHGWDQLVQRGGERGQLSVAALLARVLLAQPRDRAGEAELLIDRCEQEAAEGQLDIQIKWRQLRAILLARRRRFDQAERLAREAVHLAGGSEQPESQAEACYDLATVLHQRGSLGEARTSAEQAVGLYEAKGNLVSAGRVRKFMVEQLT